MAECIQFRSAFHRSPMERVFIPDEAKEWIIKEKWSVNFLNVIQKIIVEKYEYFESYYYVDLEIISVLPKSDAKILKSERMASNNIKFLIHSNEYKCFEARSSIGDSSKNHANLYQYKIILTPVLQFIDEIFRKPGKRTKIDLLEGLKKLSEDISLIRNDEFSDVIICCGDKQVKAHRNILCARSTLLKKVLQNAVADEEVEDHFEIIPEIRCNDASNTVADDLIITKVKLKNIDSSVFDEVVDFIYSGRYKTFDIERAKDLFIAARNYGIYDLENKCVVYLNSKISTETIEDIYNFACECRCEKLQTCALDYAKNKIFGKKRRRVRSITGVGGQDDANNETWNEEEMTETEKMRWLEIMRNHPTYLKNIPKGKKNSKLRQAFSISVPDADAFDEDDEIADNTECSDDNLRTCEGDAGNVED